MSMSRTLSAALQYAQHGWHVFPCRGKVPATPNGLKDATTNPQSLRRMWFSGANVAIVAGPSNLVIIDVDNKHGVDGTESLARMQRTLCDLPPTLEAGTPNNGQHHFFSEPAGMCIRPSVGKLAPGIDIRAGASYVVATPSVIGGRAYSWTARQAPMHLPSQWVDALRDEPRSTTPTTNPAQTRPNDGRVRAYCLAALRREADALATTASGQRNDTLVRSAARLGGLLATGGIDRIEIETALGWACEQWNARSVRKDSETITRGLDFGSEHPREVDWNDQNDHETRKTNE